MYRQNRTERIVYTRVNVTNYYAWHEFLQQEPTEIIISNFTISPGDNIFVEVIVHDSFFPNQATFEISNLTTNQTTNISTPANTNIPGRSVEWIMERPLVSGSVPPLANYGNVSMEPLFQRAGMSVGIPSNDNSMQISMINTIGPNINTLSTPTITSNGWIRSDWHNFI